MTSRPRIALAAALVVAGAILCLPVPASAAASVARATAAASYDKEVRTIGHSVRGRAIKAWFRGDPAAEHVLVVLGQMHGDERAGPATARWMRDHVRPQPGTAIWVIPTMNPDGAARGTRQNARGVDLNRNWPTSGWQRSSKGYRYFGGPRPASEPETRAVMDFLAEVRPDYIASIHQPLRGIGRSGHDVKWERRLARELNLPRRHFGVGNPSGTVSPTMTGWYNVRHGQHGTATTIEYGARTTERYRTRVAGRGIARAARIR